MVSDMCEGRSPPTHQIKGQVCLQCICDQPADLSLLIQGGQLQLSSTHADDEEGKEGRQKRSGWEVVLGALGGAHQAQESEWQQDDGGAIVDDQREAALDGLQGHLAAAVICGTSGRQLMSVPPGCAHLQRRLLHAPGIHVWPVGVGVGGACPFWKPCCKPFGVIARGQLWCSRACSSEKRRWCLDSASCWGCRGLKANQSKMEEGAPCMEEDEINLN